MNALAIIVGYFVISCVAVSVFAVVLGKSLKFLGREQPPAPEPEDWDPAPRSLGVPHAVLHRQPTEDHLRDPNTRDTPTPSDPAS